MKESSKFTYNIMSIALIIYGLLMLPSIAVALNYGETGVWASMLVLSLCSIFAGAMAHFFLNNNLSTVSLRVCYITTVSVWICLIFLSTIPYIASNNSYPIIDIIFTTMASWTTCSTSAIPLEILPKGLLMWKCTCNWIGGIGIILLVLSFLPQWQFIGQKLVSTEIRGPGYLMNNTTFRQAYRRIIFIYLGFTIIQYVALRIAGMGRLTALFTTLSNASTSGVQHLNNGLIYNYPLNIKIIISFFAFLGSLNISVFVLLLVRKYRKVFKNTELRFYLGFVLAATIIFNSIKCISNNENFFHGFAPSLMQIVSFSSTSGFYVTDPSRWPLACCDIVIMVILVGSCAISSGGGIKASRVSLALLNVKSNLYMHIHPKGVRPIIYNDEPASSRTVARSNVYILLFFVVFFFGALLITLDGTPVYDALLYSQAMLTNTGIPITNTPNSEFIYSVSDFSKIVMSFLMICGRLEIYPILLVFTRGFWRERSE
ncbi:MAG: TrkH family potassium uptake protein [Mogibacterium sp.]|nr:TrkH family potassium uptake protein [Mogibacterium sp.]